MNFNLIASINLSLCMNLFLWIGVEAQIAGVKVATRLPLATAITDTNQIDAKLAALLIKHAPAFIKDLIKIMTNKDAPLAALRSRLLLHGEPGTGKSQLALAIAHATGRECIIIEGSCIANEYQHSGSQKIKKDFEDAMQKNVPMVIIIEEINNLVNHYNDGKSMDKDMTTQFWRMLDKAVANPNILVIGTANDISKFPEAVKSRFVGNIVKIEGPKTEEERIEVLKFYLQRHNNSCDSEGIKEVVKNTPMLFPRQLEQIVKNAIGIAFARDGKGEITSGDLKESAKKIIEDHKAFPSGPTQWEKFKNAANEIAVPAGVAASVATVVGALKKNNSPDVAAAAANKAAPVVEKAAAFAAQRATVIVKNLEPAGKKIVIILTRAGQEIARRI